MPALSLTQMDQPKTRQEKGKGKGAKTKEVFNQRTIRLKEAAAAAGAARAAAAGSAKKGAKGK
jgi:hypothetical protein